MSDVPPAPNSGTGRRGKHHAILVAVKPKRGTPNVYAILSLSVADALAAAQEAAGDEATVELAGKLSKRLARTLKLQPGEVRKV